MTPCAEAVYSSHEGQALTCSLDDATWSCRGYDELEAHHLPDPSIYSSHEEQASMSFPDEVTWLCCGYDVLKAYPLPDPSLVGSCLSPQAWSSSLLKWTAVFYCLISSVFLSVDLLKAVTRVTYHKGGSAHHREHRMPSKFTIPTIHTCSTRDRRSNHIVAIKTCQHSTTAFRNIPICVRTSSGRRDIKSNGLLDRERSVRLE